jgi:hypothetical protein
MVKISHIDVACSLVEVFVDAFAVLLILGCVLVCCKPMFHNENGNVPELNIEQRSFSLMWCQKRMVQMWELVSRLHFHQASLTVSRTRC